MEHSFVHQQQEPPQEQSLQERPSTSNALTGGETRTQKLRRYQAEYRKRKRDRENLLAQQQYKIQPQQHPLQQPLQLPIRQQELGEHQAQQQQHAGTAEVQMHPYISNALTGGETRMQKQRKYQADYRKRKSEQEQLLPQQHPIQQKRRKYQADYRKRKREQEQYKLQHSTQQQELKEHQAQQQHAGTAEAPMQPSTSNALSTQETRRQIKGVDTSPMFLDEIPDLIAVDTRFITKKMAAQEEILLSQPLLLSPVILFTGTDTKICTKDLCETEKVGAVVEPVTSHAFVQTDSTNPLRDREQQTMQVINQIDIGIQCDWENDTNLEAVEADINPFEDCNNEYQIFLEFMQKNTVAYSNSKKECLVCGEICVDSKQTLSHMTKHWGPTALCEFCGQQMEHVSLLLLHKCDIQPKQKHSKRIQHQQCPLYSCGLMTKSQLRLHDHINSHLGSSSFRCLSCKRIFLTRHEMRQHFADQRRCLPKYARFCLHYNSSHSKKNGIYNKRSSLSQRFVVAKGHSRWNYRDMLRCQICLVKCLSPSLFATHRKKCVKSFLDRLKETRNKDLWVTNGFRKN